MKKQSGFTVIEVLVVIAFLVGASLVGLSQSRKVQQSHHDTLKKTALNAMHYSLEEGFYKQHGFYPEHITDQTLPTMDASLLVDPTGKKLGERDSAYRYEPRGCQEGKCRAYTLRANLTYEADFIKESRRS